MSLPNVIEIKNICKLRRSLHSCFLARDISISKSWMQDLFTFNLKSKDDNDWMKEDLFEMNASTKLKMSFIQCS